MFLFWKYTYCAIFQTEAWVAAEDLEVIGKIICGRGRANLLPKPISGPLCTNLCIVSLKKQNTATVVQGFFFLTFSCGAFLSKNVVKCC